jgi:hypothetical protein
MFRTKIAKEASSHVLFLHLDFFPVHFHMNENNVATVRLIPVKHEMQLHHDNP